MTTSENPTSALRSNKFEFYPWKKKEFVILLVNGLLLLIVAICGIKIIIELLIPGGDKKALWIPIIVTIITYLYSIILAKGSVQTFEKDGKITNITQMLRFYSFVYYMGFALVYWVAIIKLAGRDYSLLRYFQYIVILLVCFLCVRVYATIPKSQDVWILATAILVTNMVHIVSIIVQYIFFDIVDFRYFFLDILILIGMAAIAIRTLFGSWKVQPE